MLIGVPLILIELIQRKSLKMSFLMDKNLTRETRDPIKFIHVF